MDGGKGIVQMSQVVERRPIAHPCPELHQEAEEALSHLPRRHSATCSQRKRPVHNLPARGREGKAARRA